MNNIMAKINFEKFQNSKRTHPLTKLNTNMSSYKCGYINFGFGRNVYVIEEPLQNSTPGKYLTQSIARLKSTLSVPHLPTT